MKQQAIEDWFSNPRSQKEVAEKYGIPVDTFNGWVNSEIKTGRKFKTSETPKEQDFCFVSAKSKANTFFIFRECGSEVEVEIKGNRFVANKKLTEKEKEFINTEILK